MAQRTSLNRPYGLVKEDDIVRDITELYTLSEGASQSLSEVLEIDNNSGTHNIIMGTSTVIKSSNEGFGISSQISLDAYGDARVIEINTDPISYLGGYLYISDKSTGYRGIQLNWSNSGTLDIKDEYLELNHSTSNRIRTSYGGSRRINIITGENVGGGATGLISTTDNDTSPVLISSRNSYFELNTPNSVILGGSGITASTPNTAYMQHSINTGVHQLAEYTVATVPTASSYSGGMIAVTDETGGYTIAFSDGTDWRRVQDRTIIS